MTIPKTWGGPKSGVIVAVLSLAVGVGANLALFTVIDAVYFRDLPVREPDRLVSLSVLQRPVPVSGATWGSWPEDDAMLEGAAAFSVPVRVDVQVGPETRRIDTAFVSGDACGVVGVPILMGRCLSRRDDMTGAPAVAVISFAFWQQALEGRTDVIGQRVRAGRAELTVVGVLARSFFGIHVGRRIDLLAPLVSSPEVLGSEDGPAVVTRNWLHIIGRLRRNVTAEAASSVIGTRDDFRQAVSTIQRVPGTAPTFELANASRGIAATTLREQYGVPLVILQAAAFAVLLIACFNLSVLIATHVASREEEFMIRSGLGARSFQLVKHVVLEAGVLCVVAGGLGLGIAAWLVAELPPMLRGPRRLDTPTDLAFNLDWRMVLVAAVAVVTAGIIASLVPAIRTIGIKAGPALVVGSPTGIAGPRYRVLLRGLVALQVALSVSLTAAAGSLIKSFVELTNQELGFEDQDVVLASVRGPLWGSSPDTTISNIDRLLDSVEETPAVLASSASVLTPLGGIVMMARIQVPGFAAADQRELNVFVNRVTARHLDVFGTGVSAGRNFITTDARGGPPVAIVDRAFADYYFGARDPVGSVIVVNDRDVTIVGVASTVKYLSLGEPSMRSIYVPLAQWISDSRMPLTLGIKVSNASDTTNHAILSRVSQLDPSLSLEFHSLSEDVYLASGRERLLAAVGFVFSLMALFITGAGSYGSFLYMVTCRKRELGVRSAIGATPASLVVLMVREALVVVSCGVVVGTAVSLVLFRALEAAYFDTTFDNGAVAVVATTVAVVSTVAMATTFAAVMRAGHADPMWCLRAQ